MFRSLKKNGILDPEGKYKNPLTGDNYSDEYYKHTFKWTKLPLYINGQNERLINVIKKNRVVLLEAGTGNGKTVLIPKYCLHAVDYNQKVVVTVPKQKLASSTASRDAVWLDVTLGDEVGYLYARSKLTEEAAIKKGSIYEPDYASRSPNTKLLFATAGSLVVIMNNDPALTEYSVLVIDEAHERSKDIDETMLYARRALRLNKNLKLVVMSATLPNSQDYLNYFGEFDPAHEVFPAVPNKPVAMNWLPKGMVLKKKDELEAEILRVIFDEILAKNEPGDILVFVKAATEGVHLAGLIQIKDPTIFTIVLSSDSNDEQNELAQDPVKYKEYKKGRPARGWSRKIVFATNVAESSLTITGLIYVIDGGTEYKSYFNARKQQGSLDSQMITKAQADQRKGRVGRDAPGVCYRLYTLDDFNKMKPRPETEVLNNDLTDTFLKYLSSPEIKGSLIKMINFVEELMDHPSGENARIGIKNLIALGLVSDLSAEGKLTDEGKIVSTIASRGKVSEVGSAKAILVGRYYGCEKTVMILVAIISIARKGIPVFFENKKPGAIEVIKEYQHKYGDIFSFYNLFMEYHLHKGRMDNTELASWAKKRFIKIKPLEAIREKAMEILKGARNILEEVEMVDDPDSIPFKDKTDLALFCLLKGYFTNICRLEKNGKKTQYTNFYPTIKTNASFDTRGESYYSMSKPPKYAFYISNFSMDKNISFKTFNVCPPEMIKLLSPQEKDLLPGLRF